MKSDSKYLFYFLSLTWGLPLTLIGLIVSFILICCGRKPKRLGWLWYFEIGKNWGGLELGLCFLCDKNSNYSLKAYELGHCIGQNPVFGPLFIPIIFIPSAIRYWYQTIREKFGKKNKSYDSIWFEHNATVYGLKWLFNHKDASK